MKQQRLFAAPKREKTVRSQASDYDRRNLESARLIVADPTLHGGVDSGLFLWATEVIRRLSGERAAEGS